MEGFSKIDLGTIPSQPARSRITRIINNKPKPKMKVSFPKKLLIIPGVVVVALFILGFILISPVRKVYSDAQATFAQVKITVAALKKEDIVQASIELDKTKESLT